MWACLRVTKATLTARRYTELLHDGITVGGTYITYTQLSLVKCGNLCQNNNTCYIFGWDVGTKECLIFTALDPSTLRSPASATLKTYYLISDPQGYAGALKFLGEYTNPWTIIRKMCTDLGGDLASPANPQFAYMLYTVSQEKDIALGLELDSVANAWIDRRGKTYTDFNWDDGEPDGGSQYYLFIRQGRFWDINNSNRTYYVPCRIP
ncbi:C-type lectin fold [Trinorchestia longiramus]|nr:C-type lectin fold [Trinorchestia longiramus]